MCLISKQWFVIYICLAYNEANLYRPSKGVYWSTFNKIACDCSVLPVVFCTESIVFNTFQCFVSDLFIFCLEMCIKPHDKCSLCCLFISFHWYFRNKYEMPISMFPLVTLYHSRPPLQNKIKHVTNQSIIKPMPWWLVQEAWFPPHPPYTYYVQLANGNNMLYCDVI